MASTLTFGQFVKAIASLLAPYLMAWGAAAAIPAFGLSWRIVFPIFAIVNVLTISALSATPITEERPDKVTGFFECLRLLGIPFVLLCFVGIMCHVGIDVGTNTFAPQILQEKIGLSVSEAVIGTQIYFYFRLGGCLLGSYILAKVPVDAMPEDPDRLVVFDINLRQNFYTKETLTSSMERCNILKINDEELVIVSRMFGYPGIDLQDKCWILLGKYNLKMLILTCGINGSYVFTPGKVYFQPTPKVEVADTVGAGDSFTAAFIASILKGESVEDAHRKAVETSAFVCTCNGAMPQLPAEITGK